jgi:hypothetical protein
MNMKTLFCVGLICSLTALMSCRTMNQKTQQRPYPLLVSLPGSASIMEDPRALLNILKAPDPLAQEGKDVIQPWEHLALPLKHQVLMRLLEIQHIRFGAVPPKPAHEGTGIDHIVVSVRQEKPSSFVFLATPQWSPPRTDALGDSYYELELLEFGSDGRLLYRASYNE